MQRGVIKRLGDQTVDVQLAGSTAVLPRVKTSGQIDISSLVLGEAVLVGEVNGEYIVLHTFDDNLRESSIANANVSISTNPLLADGTVPLTGNLYVTPGVTIDGYDISVLGQAINNLQAADTIARTGWTALTHGTHIVSTVTADATQILVRDAIFELNEQAAVSNTAGEVEVMRITSGPTSTVDDEGVLCYQYDVERRVQVSPGGLYTAWAAATLINGLTKRGYITVDGRHANSINSPNITGGVWLDDPPTTQERVFRLGNLKGILNIQKQDFGIALGALDSETSYILYNASQGEAILKNVDYLVLDDLDEQIVRIYGQAVDDRLGGDYDFGKLSSIHNSFYGDEPRWGVYRIDDPIIEINENYSFIKGLLTIGDPVAARINIGVESDRSIIALRNKFGVIKAMLSTNDDGDVFAHIGNAPPEANSISYDGATNIANVDAHVTMRSASVAGRLEFQSTGEFMVVDPDDPGRFGVTTPRGQYAYTTNSLGETHLIRVDAWGPLVLEDVLGSGTWRTWVGGSQVFGDPRYRHFRIERGATARAGLFNGDTGVVWMDAAGVGHFTGGGVFNKDVEVVHPGRILFGGGNQLDAQGLKIVSSPFASLDFASSVSWLDQVNPAIIAGQIQTYQGLATNTLLLTTGPDNGNGPAEGVVKIAPQAGTAMSSVVLIEADRINLSGITTVSDLRPTSDSTTALKVQNAAGTADILTVDTTGRRLNINSATSNAALSIQPYSADDSNVYLRNSSGTLVGAIVTGASSVSFSGQGSADFQFITASGKAFIFKQMAGIIAFRDYQDYEAARVTDAEWAFNYNGNPSFDVRIRSATLSHLFFADGSANKIGIGASSPDTILHVQLDDAATNAASQLLTLSHNTSGTVANGFGSRVLWELESSTTADQTAAALDVLWTEKTHASRTSKLVASIVQSGTLYELASLGGSGAIFNDGGESWADFRVEGDTATHLLFVDASVDAVGIGTSAPSSRFHVSQTTGDAGIREVVRVAHNSSGTPGKGFGVSLALALETTTTENMVAGLVAASWDSATHASRAGDLIGYAADASGEREGWRVRASGSAPMFSLFGATPILRPTTSHAAATFTANSGTAVNDASTFDGYTLKQVVKALRNIGILT